MIIMEEPRMRREEERLRTFRDWPSDSPVTAVDLAKAGFYFVGPGDKVQCFCCGGILRCWTRGDNALGEHKRHFPTCRFVLGSSVGNIRHFSEHASSDRVDGQLLSQLQRMTMDDQVAVGQAVYPELQAEESRFTTFRNWPPASSVQPEILARAGFFYSGHDDSVKCFYCDGGLRNWEPGDDPWQEHAKWFPRCEFLLQARGREYVSSIQHFHFNNSETLSGSPSSAGRDVNPRRDVVYYQGSPSLISPVVQTVLQMGFQASLVESLVQTKYLLTGEHYTCVSDLVADMLQAEEEERQGSVQTRVTKGLSAEEQLRQLQEERTCKICMDKPVSMVFVPCGHLVACADCAASLHHCPICRTVIRGSVRTFMS